MVFYQCGVKFELQKTELGVNMGCDTITGPEWIKHGNVAGKGTGWTLHEPLSQAHKLTKGQASRS